MIRDLLIATGWPYQVANLWLLGVILTLLVWVATTTTLVHQDWLDHHGEDTEWST